MKVSELSGAMLDLWAAKADGWIVTKPENAIFDLCIQIEKDGMLKICYEVDDVWRIGNELCWFSPSTNWAQGGPIIEREQITIIQTEKIWTAMPKQIWGYDGPESDSEMEGPTPLIAAMRAFVHSKFGDEVPD